MAYYQVIGYNWNHWANREVSRVTKSNINHVSIRVSPFCGDSQPHELYVSHRTTDTWVPSRVVERINGPPVWKGRMVTMKCHAELEFIKMWAQWWKDTEPGNLIKPYLYHYFGRRFGLEAPWTCTRLCATILDNFGIQIKERFYPNLFIQEYIKETY